MISSENPYTFKVNRVFYKMMLKSPCFCATHDSGFSISTNFLSGFGLPEISGFVTYINIVCLS